MKRLGLLVLVFLAAVAPFTGAVRYGRVNCDDYDYTGRHTPMAAGLTRESVRYAFTDVTNAIWMPLTHLAYGMDFALSGGDDRRAMSFAHAGNILWHGCNAVLLFILLSSLIPNPSSLIPFLLSLLWAVHPLRCESVVWIASKKDVISGFFLLLAILSWMRWRGTGLFRFYVISLVLVVLGAMAKPSVMVFVGIAALLDFCLFRCPLGLRLAFEYCVPILLCLAIAVEAAVVQGVGGATGALATVPLWWKALNALTSVGVYALNTVCPISLAPQCMMRFPALPARVTVALPVGVGLVFLVWRLFRAKSVHLLGLGWFLGALVPFLGLSGFGYHAFADRFTYVPALGLSVAFVLCFAPHGGFGVRTARLVGSGATCAVLLLSAASVRQTAFWRDDGVLWRHTLEVDGGRNYIGNLNLALWHLDHEIDLGACARHFAVAWAHDHGALGKNAFFYVVALVELGEMRKADGIIIGLRDLIHDIIEAGGTAQDELWTKEMSTILVAAADGNANPAQSMLDGLVKVDPGFGESADGLYLRSWIAAARGDGAEAERLRKVCSEAARRLNRCYIQYRFLAVRGKDEEAKE